MFVYAFSRVTKRWKVGYYFPAADKTFWEPNEYVTEAAAGMRVQKLVSNMGRN